MCWANVGDWSVQLVDGWRWRHIIGPTYLHQQSLWCCRPNVGTTQLDEHLFWRCQPSIGLTQLNQLLSWHCWSNVGPTLYMPTYVSNLFFNFKYYLTCAYAIIRSILTTKKVSNCVYGMVNPWWSYIFN